LQLLSGADLLPAAAGGGCFRFHTRPRHAPGGAEDVSGLPVVRRCTACGCLLADTMPNTLHALSLRDALAPALLPYSTLLQPRPS
jgi:hypothetical protein